MTFADGWICRVCWQSNRQQDAACYRCKAPREADDAQVEERRKAEEARATAPEPVPDIVVALPATVFRVYGRVWIRGGIGLLGVLALLVFGGVTELGWLGFTAILAVGLIAFGFAAGQVSDGMRDREAWAYIVGIIMDVVGVGGSIAALDVLDLPAGVVNPTAIRWGSVIIFGGAGVAAAAGLVMLFTHRQPGG